MITIGRPRAGGKTYTLIQKWINSGGTLIVPDYQQKMRIVEQYKLSQKQRNRIVVYDYPLIRAKVAGLGEPVYIDNVDHILAMMLGRYPEIVSYTGKPDTEPERMVGHLIEHPPEYNRKTLRMPRWGDGSIHWGGPEGTYDPSKEYDVKVKVKWKLDKDKP